MGLSQRKTSEIMYPCEEVCYVVVTPGNHVANAWRLYKGLSENPRNYCDPEGWLVFAFISNTPAMINLCPVNFQFCITDRLRTVLGVAEKSFFTRCGSNGNAD